MAASRARFINWSRLMPRRSESRRATWMPAYRPSAIMIPYQWIFRPPIVTNTGSIPILISTDQVYEFRVAGFPASNVWFRVAGFPACNVYAMRDKPSFTDEVKAELANVDPAKPCCQEAELAAIVEALAGAGDAAPQALRIPRNAVARKVVHLAKLAGGRVEPVRKGATEKRPSYRLRLTPAPGRGSGNAFCARAILRGAFLARGLLGNPADAYHLELALPEGGGAS